MKSTSKAILLAGIIAGSLLTGSGAIAGVKNTKHNLGSTGTGANNMDGTGEVCVFCHTPHGSDTAAAVPLWNKKIDDTGFTTYDTLGTSTLDGGIAKVGSVSVACLSCHDGTQAMDVMINQPGSGGYNAAGARLAGTWTGAGVDGLMPAGIANLAKDLTNDHPIGIQYAGGGYTNAGGTPSTAADKDFKAPTKVTINSTPVWYVETGKNAGREKTDLPLYTRNTTDWQGGALAGENEPFVECASCHDPHVEDVAGSNPTFLRIANTNSDVCLACHTK
ncbi:cytochrome c3 family protein [Thalassotalea sp. G2M2-11]|uniref:cytochrome c3 family protein n=1 Tax=Thalassotalea sp. G2M2-11 TaxID=2787627 RepID=UPI0019D28595|nr:cytochrome c3 family protein [Thalassotalea sp. G2M2-11]